MPFTIVKVKIYLPIYIGKRHILLLLHLLFTFTIIFFFVYNLVCRILEQF